MPLGSGRCAGSLVGYLPSLRGVLVLEEAVPVHVNQAFEFPASLPGTRPALPSVATETDPHLLKHTSLVLENLQYSAVCLRITHPEAANSSFVFLGRGKLESLMSFIPKPCMA